jgi:hypothetical protein
MVHVHRARVIKGRERHRRRSGASQADSSRGQNTGSSYGQNKLLHRFVSFQSNELLCAPWPFKGHGTRTWIPNCCNDIGHELSSPKLLASPTVTFATTFVDPERNVVGRSADRADGGQR